jgi:hypothetical protein
MAFKRSAVRLRLAPPLKSMNINMFYCIIFLSLRHPTLGQHRGSTLNRSRDRPVDPSWGGNSLGREQPPPAWKLLSKRGGSEHKCRSAKIHQASRWHRGGRCARIARLMGTASGAANAQCC